MIKMKNLRHFFPALLISLLTACSFTPDTSTPAGLTESGTFTIRQSQVLAVAVGRSGEGTLIFNGWEYGFVFENMKVGVPSNESVELRGVVYNADEVDDFEGQYTVTTAAITSGEGLTGVWAKNDSGVVVHLFAEGQDLELDLRTQGAKITLK